MNNSASSISRNITDPVKLPRLHNTKEAKRFTWELNTQHLVMFVSREFYELFFHPPFTLISLIPHSPLSLARNTNEMGHRKHGEKVACWGRKCHHINTAERKWPFPSHEIELAHI